MTGLHERGYAYESDTPYSMHGAIASWFLGPQSENQNRLQDYFQRALEFQTDARMSFHPEDGVGASLYDLRQKLTMNSGFYH